MIVYDIKLYDLKTDSETVVAVLPERRKDYDRPRGRITIEKWAKSLLGEDWWLQNWHNILITQESHWGDRRDSGNGRNRCVPRPPKTGGVE